MVRIFLPGEHVYIDLRHPLSDHASGARVNRIRFGRSELIMGEMSGWYPNRLIARTEAEAIRLGEEDEDTR